MLKNASGRRLADAMEDAMERASQEAGENSKGSVWHQVTNRALTQTKGCLLSELNRFFRAISETPAGSQGGAGQIEQEGHEKRHRHLHDEVHEGKGYEEGRTG